MNASQKVAARLRTEPTLRLRELLQFYPRDTKAIEAEINRRNARRGITLNKPTA